MTPLIIWLIASLVIVIIALIRSEKGKRELARSLRITAEESLNNSQTAEHWKKMFDSRSKDALDRLDKIRELNSEKSDLLIALTEKDKEIEAKNEDINKMGDSVRYEKELRKVAQTETRHLRLVLAQKTADFEELKMRYDRLLRGVDFKAKKQKPRTAGKKGGVK